MPAIDRRLLAAQIAGMFVVFAGVLFGAAGTLHWPAGWSFMVLFFAFVIAFSLWLSRSDPALLAERMTGIGKADQKRWDKAFFAIANVLFLAWLMTMPLDAVRFHWSHVAGWLQWCGATLLVVSFVLFFWVSRTNTFLSPAIRIQSERRQTVISAGPYARVRHPMYAATIPLFIGAALQLGSWYGVLAALPLLVAIAVRAVFEERTLRAELEGYDEYAKRVRWRMVPGVW